MKRPDGVKHGRRKMITSIVSLILMTRQTASCQTTQLRLNNDKRLWGLNDPKALIEFKFENHECI